MLCYTRYAQAVESRRPATDVGDLTPRHPSPATRHSLFRRVAFLRLRFDEQADAGDVAVRDVAVGLVAVKRFRVQGSEFRIRSLVLEKIPFFALSAASSIVTFFAQRHGSSVVPLEALPLGARLANAVIAPVRYLLKTIWPADLIVFYPYRGWNWMAIAGAAFVLIGISIWAMRRAKDAPHLLVGWLWYLGMLVPVVGLVQVGGQSIADRYTYVPLIGVFIAVVWSVRLAAGTPTSRSHALATALAVAVLAICGALSSVQVRYWRNSEILYGHALKVMPNNLVAHNNLGLAFAKRAAWRRQSPRISPC